jgi:5-methyltetrahydrofolate--homocysteine methyltransferase
VPLTRNGLNSTLGPSPSPGSEQEIVHAFADCCRGTITLTDDAWSTEFQKLAAAFGVCTDEWNLSNPELVHQVAESYIRAGSRVILTNSFRANSISLAQCGLLDRVVEINRAAVRISRRAAGDSALVFASERQDVGTGEVNPAQLRKAFSQQVSALAAEGDALLIETMTDLAEDRIAAAAALETRLPVIVSFVFDTGKNRDPAILGVSPRASCRRSSERRHPCHWR